MLLLVVLVVGLGCGLAAGMTLVEIVELFGRLFVEGRYMTLPVLLTLLVVALLEEHGLRERAQGLIARMRAATAGRVLLLYTAVRQISIALGINLGGHAGMVRPVVAPMAEAAARAQHGALSPEALEQIRAHAACAENVGNFFGEDIFIAVGAVLLMKGYFEAEGIAVGVWRLALWGIPTAITAFVVMILRLRRLDRRLAQLAKERR